MVSHPEDLVVFEYDGSVAKGMPETVVFPRSAEQVSQVLGLAYEEGIPVVGRGSGTGLSGGAIAATGGMQIAFTRMNSILELDMRESNGDGGAGGNQPGPGQLRPKERPAVCAGPFQPEGVYVGGQRGRERRRAPLPGLRHHHQPRIGIGSGAGRRERGQYWQRGGTGRSTRHRAMTYGEYFSVRRGHSG